MAAVAEFAGALALGSARFNGIDLSAIARENHGMIASADLRELKQLAEQAATGVRDAETMRLAAERLRSMREHIRQRSGEMDISVGIIREMRGELPDA